jgi:hypothetical protein
MRTAFYLAGAICFSLGAIALLDYVGAILYELWDEIRGHR